MALDPVRNFIKLTVAGFYDAAATSIEVNVGEGATLPNPGTEGHFNMVWYNDTDYPDPTDDPNAEIVRVSAESADILTIARAQEGTAASTKNTAGKTYKLLLAVTAKMINDINVEINTPPGGVWQKIAIASGLQNGINRVYTLAKVPVDGCEFLFLQGQKQIPTDYSRSGATITFATYSPVVGDYMEFYAFA